MKKYLDILSFINDNLKDGTTEYKRVKEIFFYTDKFGKCRMEEWIDRLDNISQERIMSRIYKLQYGSYGDYKRIDSKLFELRFFFGKGYRIYFTEQDNKIIFLLNAGDKDSQSKDIKKAKSLLKELLAEEK